MVLPVDPAEGGSTFGLQHADFVARRSISAWNGILLATWCLMRCGAFYEFVAGTMTLPEVFARRPMLGLLTMVRVMVLIALASVIWTRSESIWVCARASPRSCSPSRNSWLLSREPAVPGRRRDHSDLSAQSGRLALAADGARYAMVHSLQCHCRRDRPAA